MGLDRAFEAANLFGITPLAARALSGRPTPKGICLTVPAKPADIPQPTQSLTLFDQPARRDLATKLEAALSPLAAHIAVIESVRKFQLDGATCIVATATPSLFGGNLSNAHKAIHLAKLANALEQQWNTPVIPVLWNHADSAELAKTHFINAHLDLIELKSPQSKPVHLPLSKFTCSNEDGQLTKLHTRLADLLEQEPNGISAADVAVPKPGETVARAWTRFHLNLFGHLGIVIVEPDWLRPELSEALADIVAPTPVPALDLANARLKNETLTDTEPLTPTVFHIESGKRRALKPGRDGWHFHDEPGSRTPAELAAEIVADKRDYNTGELLLPMLQQSALPIAAFVGDSVDLRNQSLLAELRQERGFDPGVFIPVLRCTLTDARARKSLAALGQTPGQFVLAQKLGTQPANHKNKAQVTAAQNAAAAAKRIAEAAAELQRALHAERATVQNLDPAMAAQLKRSANSAQREVQELANRIANAAANDESKNRRHQRRLEALLYPQSKPQDQLITTAQILARFGRAWIDELFEATDPLPSEHLVAHIDPHAQG